MRERRARARQGEAAGTAAASCLKKKEAKKKGADGPKCVAVRRIKLREAISRDAGEGDSRGFETYWARSRAKPLSAIARGVAGQQSGDETACGLPLVSATFEPAVTQRGEKNAPARWHRGCSDA
ncbi:hypothetical protein ERJ75_000607900 [Trypanosoma vivax]|nr:hypothetical protein ERJ75_000607900 [Trypanosoma vivax]